MATTLRNPDARLLADAHRFSEELNGLVRVVQFRDRDRACCFDVSVTQCHALQVVADEGPLTINDLAARLYLDKSTASRVAGGLETKGYVVRTGDLRDGRIVRLEATDRGRALRRRIQDGLATDYAELLSDFDPEVRAAVTRLLGRLAVSFARHVEASGGSCAVVR